MIKTQSVKPKAATPTNNTMLSLSQLKLLSKNLAAHLKSMDSPPADEVYVNIDQIEPLKEPNRFSAEAKFVVNYAGIKNSYHKVLFTVDALGRVIPSTVRYATR